jgi:hypothetical protein
MTDDLDQSLKNHVDVLCHEPRTPQSAGYFKVQEYLKNCLQAMELTPQEHHFSVWGLPKCTNIFAENSIAGPRLLIGAHYETRDCSGVGADDNASAVAVAIEVAKRLSSRVPLTVIFFDMEEQWRWRCLQGSKAFAKFNVKPLARVIILDLVGGVLAPGFENIFLQFGPGFSQLRSPSLEFLHLPMSFLEPLGEWAARSDYDGFRRKNIPYTFITSGTPWYYHTAFDRPEILHFSKMAELVKTICDNLDSPEAMPDEKTARASFLKFARKINNIPELHYRLTAQLIDEERLPSRLEMVRIYAHVLPRMRRHGPKLWHMR